MEISQQQVLDLNNMSDFKRLYSSFRQIEMAYHSILNLFNLFLLNFNVFQLILLLQPAFTEH